MQPPQGFPGAQGPGLGAFLSSLAAAALLHRPHSAVTVLEHPAVGESRAPAAPTAASGAAAGGTSRFWTRSCQGKTPSASRRASSKVAGRQRSPGLMCPARCEPTAPEHIACPGDAPPSPHQLLSGLSCVHHNKVTGCSPPAQGRCPHVRGYEVCHELLVSPARPTSQPPDSPATCSPSHFFHHECSRGALPTAPPTTTTSGALTFLPSQHLLSPAPP